MPGKNPHRRRNRKKAKAAQKQAAKAAARSSKTMPKELTFGGEGVFGYFVLNGGDKTALFRVNTPEDAMQCCNRFAEAWHLRRGIQRVGMLECRVGIPLEEHQAYEESCFEDPRTVKWTWRVQEDPNDPDTPVIYGDINNAASPPMLIQTP